MRNPAFLEANANTDAAQLSDALPAGTQGHFRSILTDEYLRVIGSEGTIYAMGDGATIYQVSCGRAQHQRVCLNNADCWVQTPRSKRAFPLTLTPTISLWCQGSWQSCMFSCRRTATGSGP